jgi:membrane associated rhomboid family serine protease
MSNGLHHPHPSNDGAHLRRAPEGAPPASVQRYAVALNTLTPQLWLTYVLIAMNVAVFVAMVVAGVSPLEPSVEGLLAWGANFGPRTTGGEWWRLFSAMFLHIGVVHLAMNMFALNAIGTFMERVFGQTGYLVVYVFAGLAGSAASVAWNPFGVSAGASGAIFGLYGALLAYIVRCREALPAQSLAGLRSSALTFLGYNVVLGFAHRGTDVAAHGGGLVGGFLIALLVAHAPNAEAASLRLVRALVATSVASGILFACASALPVTPDLDAAIDRFRATEHEVIDAYNRGLREARDGALDDTALAARIDAEVRVPWLSARAPLADLRGLPDAQRAIVEKYVRYIDARAAAWERAADALRRHDGDAFRAADEGIRDALKELD